MPHFPIRAEESAFQLRVGVLHPLATRLLGRGCEIVITDDNGTAPLPPLPIESRYHSAEYHANLRVDQRSGLPRLPPSRVENSDRLDEGDGDDVTASNCICCALRITRWRKHPRSVRAFRWGSRGVVAHDISDPRIRPCSMARLLRLFAIGYPDSGLVAQPRF